MPRHSRCYITPLHSLAFDGLGNTPLHYIEQINNNNNKLHPNSASSCIVPVCSIGVALFVEWFFVIQTFLFRELTAFHQHLLILHLTASNSKVILTYLLTPLCSQWSIGHQRTPAIALCSGLLLSFRTSWSPAVSALLQCLASNCCEAGLSSSSLAGSRSGLGVWCWMLASRGCVRSSPTFSAVSAWPLVPVPLAPTDLHFGSSLAIGFCRCASDRCWRMSGSFVASSVLSAMSHIRKAGLTSHWSWRCGVWFS